MVVACCVKDCVRSGNRRIKALMAKYPNLPLDKTSPSSTPRMCEVHYTYFNKRLEESNKTKIKFEGEEYESVEYLDEYLEEILKDCDADLGLNPLSYENRIVPDDQHIGTTLAESPIFGNENKLLTQLQKSFNFFWKIFMFVILCVTLIFNMNTIDNINDAWRKVADERVDEIKKLRRENQTLKLSLESTTMRFEKQSNNIRARLLSIFNDDQIDMLYRDLSRPREWSDPTILQSMKTKFACTSRGYTHLLHSNYPLPSERTLRERMEGLNFMPGILDDVFVFLTEKVKFLNEFERECLLVVDEMSIIEGKQYDIGSKSHIGEITLPLAKSDEKTVATHVLVFMIVGLSSRYKQIVAYHFTGNSISAPHFRDVVIEIVKKAWSIGLKCNGLSSDMGGSNTAVWKLWGIKATRKGEKIINSIIHPCDPLRRFWIVGDVPHVLKRAVQSILNNKMIVFDDFIVEKYELSNNTVKSSDLFELFNIQKDDQLKLAPKLKSHILSPNNFQKMNVPVSTNLIGKNVSTSLHYLYSQLQPSLKVESTYETTAWFCQVLTRWFKLVSSRHIALSLTTSTYEDIADDLNEVIEIMRHAKFGADGKWKPFQRGILVTTTSLLEMSEYLLKHRKFEYFLPGRCSQDCVENLFSIIRSGNSKPNAQQILHSIKNISISEYLSHPLKNTSYHFDDSQYLNKFLIIVRKAKEDNQKKKEELFQNDQIELKVDLKSEENDFSKVVLNKREQNVLYKVACFILYKVSSSKIKLHCDVCLSQCRLKEIDVDKPYTSLMRQPNLQYHCTNNNFYINNEVFKYFLLMEKMFRVVHPIISEKNKFNLNRLITSKILDLGYDCDITNCHSLQKTLTNRFVTFRLKNAGIQRSRKRKFDFSSQSQN